MSFFNKINDVMTLSTFFKKSLKEETVKQLCRMLWKLGESLYVSLRMSERWQFQHYDRKWEYVVTIHRITQT